MRKWTPRVKVDTAYNVSVCVCVITVVSEKILVPGILLRIGT